MNKKTLNTIMTIDAVALLVVTLFWIITVSNAYGENIDFGNSVIVCSLAICSILAIFYQLFGCKKEYGSKVYKVFLIVFAIFELTSILYHNLQTNLQVVMIALRFAALVLLSEAKDLGETKSKVVALVIIATTICDIFTVMFANMFVYSWKGLIVELTLEISCLLMVIRKYVDKKERGTK